MKKILQPLLLIFLFSCGSSGREEIPPGVLPKEKMVDVMCDIELARGEQSVNIQQKINDPSADTISYTAIFLQNKIKKAEYDSSMQYYTLHPELLNEIYDEVINRLEMEKKQK